MSDEERKPNPISAEAVAEYLKAHPDFFSGRESLLAELVLPHDNPGAVSLVERQMGVLRDRNADMRARLTDLVRTARINHHIFERTLELTSALLEADEADVIQLMSQRLERDFDVDAVRLLAIEEAGFAAEVRDQITPVGADVARAAAPNLLRPDRIVCGLLRDAEVEFLFGERASQIASAAVMPVSLPGGILLIALGSSDANHFTPDMGTLFLRFLGDTLTRVMTRDAETTPDLGEASGAA